MMSRYSNGLGRYTKVSRLQSNKVSIPTFSTDRKIEIVYKLTDNKCFAQRLSPRRQNLAKLIERLTNGGLDNKQIVDYLNNEDIKTARGKEFNVKDLWSFKKKMGDRYDRVSRTEFRVIKDPIIVRSNLTQRDGRKFK